MAGSVLLYGHWQGKKKKKLKRGFPKAEASQWAMDFLQQQQSDLDMVFEKYVELYYEDIENHLKETTMRTKKYIIDLKILPYFKDKRINDIKAADIRKWQNKLLHEGYTPTYL